MGAARLHFNPYQALAAADRIGTGGIEQELQPVIHAVTIPVAVGVRQTPGGQAVGTLVAIGPGCEAVVDGQSCSAPDRENFTRRPRTGWTHPTGAEGQGVNPRFRKPQRSGNSIAQRQFIRFIDAICGLEMRAKGHLARPDVTQQPQSHSTRKIGSRPPLRQRLRQSHPVRQIAPRRLEGTGSLEATGRSSCRRHLDQCPPFAIDHAICEIAEA